jgi:hypothetical protein
MFLKEPVQMAAPAFVLFGEGSSGGCDMNFSIR